MVSGSTPARRSFCTGLPPQSTRIAPPSPTNTSEVVSRATEGTAAEVPRKMKSISRPFDECPTVPATPLAHQGQHRAQITLESRPQVLSFVVVVDLRDELYKRQHLRSEEHTSELQSLTNLVCRLLLEKK